MRHGLLALGLLASCLAACGDDDDGGSVSSGLPASQQLSSLDAAEAQKLCSSLKDGFNDLLTDAERERIECAATAIGQSVTKTDEGGYAGDVAMCQMLVDRCLKGEVIGIASGVTFADDFITCGDTTSASLQGCDATVGNIESCMNALLGKIDEQYDLLDCKQLADVKKLMQKIDDQPDDPIAALPQCQVLLDKCPALELDDDSE